MQYVKALLIFAVGVALGAAGGGYLGYEIGSADPAIQRASRAAVIPVQPVSPPAAPQQPEPTAAPPEAPAAPPEEPPVAGTHHFIISPNDDSSIMWVGYKSVLGQKMSMNGGFANFEGTITVENADPAKSRVDVTIDINSIFSVNSILTGVLKGADFFNAAEYPEAQFVSTQVETTAEGYLITGNFTMRGVTQGLQFPAKIEKRDDGLYATAEFIIDRKQWNVGYDSYEDSLILNEAVVQLEILADPA